MIEVNLLPGARKRPNGGSALSLSLPALKRLSLDPFVLGTCCVVVLLAAAAGYLVPSANGRIGAVAGKVGEARRDSLRYAELVAGMTRLEKRIDSIAERVSIIQEIDAARYVAAHLLDEVAHALPDHTWLTELVQLPEDGTPRIRISGRAGTIPAVTSFMQRLEASPFIREVTLAETTSLAAGEVSGSSGQSFVLEAFHEVPSPEILRTVPLFDPPPLTEAQ